jgi:hypothetical protein
VPQCVCVFQIILRIYHTTRRPTLNNINLIVLVLKTLYVFCEAETELNSKQNWQLKIEHVPCDAGIERFHDRLSIQSKYSKLLIPTF